MKYFSFFYIIFLTFSKLSVGDEYYDKIKPIFDNRCVACHSCLNSPCQLNLQSYSGFIRGANKENVYNGTRLKSVPPTRLDIDAQTENEWRKLNFYSIHQSKKDSIFYNALRTRPLSLRDIPYKSADESNSCISDEVNLKTIFRVSEDLKMPYALPTLSDLELSTLKDWVATGSKGSETIQGELITRHEEIIEWEKYFNQNNSKQKLISRYIYEHLFLAHVYFKENPTKFYRIIRSSRNCQLGPLEIATRRTNEYPGTDEFFYCFKPVNLTIVAKTHMPFLFTPKILEETRHLFESLPWNVNNNYNTKESYSNSIAENPFWAFNDIPAKIRYQFLLKNAHFMISTFIKGPVCDGSIALNSIQEQFYVLFLKPEAGFLTSTISLNENLNDLLTLPGTWGSDIKISETWKLAKTLVLKREEYRRKRNEWLTKARPLGHELSDIWDGDGDNDNATLTVFRHDDNAVVVKGLKGDLSKTAFVLDYSLFERLVYNLVVNFDVFGNIGHQLLTRMYMDYLRMEAEENYLLFLPPDQRLPLRKNWYKGVFTDLTMSYIFPLIIKDHPVNIKYNNMTLAQEEFIENIFYNYLRPKVKGEEDLINWKKIQLKNGVSNLSKIESELRKISSLNPKGRIRFPIFFPETSYLIIKKNDNTQEVYSIIKNREHDNISWILGESLRLDPDNFTLSILKGFDAFFPNYFFSVSEDQLPQFTEAVLKLSYPKDYSEFKKTYGVSRVAPNFWKVYDQLNASFKETDPVQFGILDLSRYLME